MKLKLLFCFVILLATYKANAQGKTKALQDKSKQLMDLTVKKSVINLNTNRFREFVKSQPKDYSFIIMFTAMSPSRRCAMCAHVYDEFVITANSYKYSNPTNGQMFFGVVDFDEGTDVFQLLRLNTAPIIMHFPSKGKPKPADTMDFERLGVGAEAIAKWIQERTDIQFRIFYPPNYSGLLALTLLLGLICSFLYLKRNNLEFLYNKQMWATVAILFCLAMISGQMWNQIRGPPFFHRTKTGPVYINGGSHGQLILESYFIALLNGAVVVGMILMIEAAGGVAEGGATSGATSGAGSWAGRLRDGKSRRLLAVVGLVLVCVFFSLLLSIFRIKTQGYPYSFLFK